MVPSAMMNTSTFSLSDDDEENERPTKLMKGSTSASFSGGNNTIPEISPAVEEIGQLHREVLQLQKRKLQLSINLLERQLVEKRDACTQTEVPIADSMRVNFTPYYHIL